VEQQLRSADGGRRGTEGKMSGTRSMASILPSIRCSDCGADVELSMMGEHMCSKQSECKAHTLRPGRHTNIRTKATPFPQLRTGQTLSKPMPEAAADRPFALKATRAPPPPRLQTNAIGTPRKSLHFMTATDNVQVAHWFRRMSLHPPAVAGALMPSPQ
jgi:hypothetical protein